jgi:AraC family transcriptional regulator of adaptative response / DNA-3-methyladenine glycosylase II
VRGILGQQITVRAARTLASRVAQRFGAPLDTPFAGVVRVFPDAATLAECEPGEIAALGIVAQRARAIVAFARALAQGTLPLAPGADSEQAIERLRALPGVGAWTAHYIAMRALHWPDAFPPGDVGVLRALGVERAAAAEAHAQAWRPWRAYAVMHLWKSRETSR